MIYWGVSIDNHYDIGLKDILLVPREAKGVVGTHYPKRMDVVYITSLKYNKEDDVCPLTIK